MASQWEKDHQTDIIITRYCKKLAETSQTALIFSMFFSCFPYLLIKFALSKLGISLDDYEIVIYIIITVCIWRILVKISTCKSIFKYSLSQEEVEDFISNTINKGW